MPRLKPWPCLKLTPLEAVATESYRERLAEAASSDGVRCDCCGGKAKVYSYFITGNMARCLAWMVRRSAANGHKYVRIRDVVPRWFLASPQYNRLKKWGLIECLRPGSWRVTQKGIDFFNGATTVQKYVHTFHNKIVKFSGEDVNFSMCTGKFDLAKLMSGKYDSDDVEEPVNSD